MAEFKRMSKRGLSVILVCMMLLSCMTPAIALEDLQKSTVTLKFEASQSVAFYDSGKDFAPLSDTLTLQTTNSDQRGYMTLVNPYYTYTFFAVPKDEDGNELWGTMPDLEILSNPSSTKSDINAQNNEVTLKIPRNVYTSTGASFEVKVKKTVETVDVNVRTSGTGFTVTPSGVTAVEKGNGFTLTIDVDDSYLTGYKVSITDNGDPKTAVQDSKHKYLYTYTILDVTVAHTISVSLVPITFKVSRDEGTENWKNVETTLRDKGETVNYGSNYTFSLAPVAGHTLASEPVTITMTGHEGGNLAKGTDYVVVGNQYTIYNITGDVTVTLNDVTGQKFNVSWSKGTGYTIVSKEESGELKNSVDYGGTLEFEVNLDPGYNSNNMTVTVNGQLKTAQDGVYTIPNITADQTILVTGVALNTYTITHKQEGNGYTFSSQSAMYNIPHGSSFSFTVTPTAGNKITDVKVTGNNIEDLVTGENGDGGVYTVTVTGDLKIEVTTSPITYSLKLPEKQTGYTISGNASSYSYNSTATLIVKAENGYTVKGVYYEVDSVRYPVTANGDNYSFKVTSDNMQVVVETDTIKYTVTYQDDKGTTTQKQYDVNSGDGVVTFVENNKNPTIKLDNGPNHDYYTFNGWKGDGVTGNKNTGYTLTLNAGETSATVTAQWTLNLEKLAQENSTKGYSTATMSYDQASKKLTVRVDWQLNKLRSSISEIFDGTYDIVSVGICYSNQSISPDNETRFKEEVGKLEKETGNEEKEEKEIPAGENQYLYYYLDGRDYAEEIATATFAFSNVTKDRYAVGWITVRIGNQTVTLYTNQAEWKAN